MCFSKKVLENSFLAIVDVNSFDILFDKNSFSSILRIDGRFDGSLISISASRSFKS